MDWDTRGANERRVRLKEESSKQLEMLEEASDHRYEEPLDLWTERARRLRPQWTSEQQGAPARALRHAPNDAAALVMAQVSLGRAQRC